MTHDNELFGEVSNWNKQDTSNSDVKNRWFNTETFEAIRTRVVYGPFGQNKVGIVESRYADDNDPEWEQVSKTDEQCSDVVELAYQYAVKYNDERFTV